MTAAQVEAYQEANISGLLSKKQALVYEYIRAHGPVSINTILANLVTRPGINTGAITGRISELKQLGVIEAAGEERGPAGYPVTLWKVTGRPPVKRARRRVSDKALLDYLDSRATTGLSWIVRQSNTGRGLRLHQDPHPAEWNVLGKGNVRDAILEAMRRERLS